jgi:predicted XRE-type DNA-binding protein
MEASWKPAIGYEGRYEVSDDGQVRSLLRKGKLLKPAKNFYGYKQVILYQDGTPKSILVHRLVAMAHIANQDNLPWVNHKNGVKDDNCVTNLEWCDRAGNVRHAVEMGLMHSSSGENNPMSKLSDLDRRIILKLLGMGLSQQSVADLFEMTQSGISRLAKKEW